MPTTVNLAAVTIWAGDTDLGRKLTDRAVALVAADPGIYVDHFVAALTGMADRVDGELASAASTMDTVIDLFLEHRSEFHVGVSRVERALIALEQGDLHLTKEVTAAILDVDTPGRSPLVPTVRARIIRARAAVLESRLSDAAAELDVALTQSLRINTWWGLIDAAEAAAELAMTRDGHGRDAAPLVAAAGQLREELGLARDVWEQRHFQALTGDISEPLGPMTQTELAAATRAVLEPGR